MDMRLINSKTGLILLAVILTGRVVSADTIDFDRDVRPILSDYCFTCHGPDVNARKAKLRFDTKEGAFADLDGYFAIVPGKPMESELFLRIEPDDVEDIMPPKKFNRPLNAKQKQTLKQWIKEGARWSEHWSYVTPRRPALPAISKKTWPRNAIDHFILARLDREKLQPSQMAAKHTLIRRVTLDLTGLPPTPTEVRAFVADTSPDAYEKLVDRLLASPRYGERMAWPWLEAARYADTNGYQGDNERTMYPWRDWVIEAFNQNMPFDQFTIWQLAGDLLPNATDEQRLATAFNRNHMINGEGGRIAEENRIEYVFDQLETTSTVWLGMTMTCCRCHDHKYDPILQKEYFGLFAFFNQTPVTGGGGNPQTPPVLSVPTKQQQEQIEQLNQKRKTVEAQLTKHLQSLRKHQVAWEDEQRNALGKSAWHRSTPTSAKATRQKLNILDDGSVLAGGINPDNDTYAVTLPVTTKLITGIRLDVLRDASMTKKSLSRAASGNFVLTDFRVELKRRDGVAPQPIKIASAKATFEQGSLKAAAAFDGKSNTGWAVWEGRVVDREHAAVFQFESPIQADAKATLIVTLKHESANRNHNIGRFKISLSDSPNPKLAASNSALAEALRTPAEKRSSKQKKVITDAFRDSDTTAQQIKKQRESIDKQLAAIRKGAPKVMIMQDMAKPRQTFMLTKGLYNQRGKEVKALLPSSLMPLPKGESMNRLGLARWLVSPDHPLTARVTVNRLWAQVFGIGLVKTTEDFGTQGERPSHPELLDWLATELVRSKWNIKHVMRLIVTSSTYKQSSKVTSYMVERDPSNRLLARGARYRMPSWMIRDQALAASGLLVDKRGGVPVKPYQPVGVWRDVSFGKKTYKQDRGEALYRRSLYTFWRRIIGPTMFFDSAARQFCEVKQFRTNTPLHALATLNDVTYVEAARSLAQQILLAKKTDAARLTYAFERVLARSPSEREQTLLMASIQRLRRQFAKDVPAAKALLTVGESKREEKLDSVDHAAWASLCLGLLNTDEALTRE